MAEPPHPEPRPPALIADGTSRALPAAASRDVGVPVWAAARAADAETVDVVDLARTVRRSWRTVIAGSVAGVAIGAALLAFVAPRYVGEASVLVRNANDPAGSILSRFGIAGDIAGAGGGALGNVLKSPLETELQLLGSRDVLGHVVDSLGLTARVESPRAVPARAVLVPAARRGTFRKRRYEFERQADGSYRVVGPDSAVTVRAGATVQLPPVGAVTLVRGALPERFTVRFEDREDAITRLGEQLSIEKLGGEVVGLSYKGTDSLTAAEVPNALIATYLQRRRTVDRGQNQRRYEFLTAQVDTVASQLAVAERALRAEQEASGVFDPEESGKAGLQAIGVVREQLSTLEAERQSVRALVREVEAGTLGPRQLAAYPTLLKSPAINSILTQLSTLEIERTRTLERRTERDPEVVALTQSIRDLEQQLLPLGRTYAAAVERQASDLARQQGDVEAQLAQLPGQALGNLQRQRDVRRLTQTMLGLQAQLIDARLAAIGEGGQVRPVDPAVPPKKIWFPRPLPTLVVSALLGLLAGVIWALARAAVTSRVRTPGDAERAAGLPAFTHVPGQPLLLGPAVRSGTLVILPLAGSVDALPLAASLVEQAREQGRRAVLVDLVAGSIGVGASLEAARAVTRAEAGSELVVVAAPGLDDRRTAAVLEPGRAALLVAVEGRAGRDRLASVAATLARLAVACVGVVLVAPGTGVPTAGDSGAARRNGTRPERTPALAGATGESAAPS